MAVAANDFEHMVNHIAEGGGIISGFNIGSKAEGCTILSPAGRPKWQPSTVQRIFHGLNVENYSAAIDVVATEAAPRRGNGWIRKV